MKLVLVLLFSVNISIWYDVTINDTYCSIAVSPVFNFVDFILTLFGTLKKGIWALTGPFVLNCNFYLTIVDPKYIQKTQ